MCCHNVVSVPRRVVLFAHHTSCQVCEALLWPGRRKWEWVCCWPGKESKILHSSQVDQRGESAQPTCSRHMWLSFSKTSFKPELSAALSLLRLRLGLKDYSFFPYSLRLFLLDILSSSLQVLVCCKGWGFSASRTGCLLGKTSEQRRRKAKEQLPLNRWAVTGFAYVVVSCTCWLSSVP